MEHNFRGHATRSQPERFYGESRVAYICGNTRGVGVVMKSPGFEREMIAALRGTKSRYKGRNLRQFILSSEDMQNATEPQFKAALVKLMRAAARWVKVYAPGCKWIAFAHADRNHPHVHLIVENWDYTKKKRLDLRPAMMEKMQDMAWARDLGLTSGKGSLGRVIAGKQLEENGATLETSDFQQRVQLLAWNSFKGEQKAALALLEWCRKNNPLKTEEGIVSMLEAGPLPPGWTLKSRTKAGNPLRRPSVVIGGRHLRINTFLDVWLDRVQPKKVPEKMSKATDLKGLGL